MLIDEAGRWFNSREWKDFPHEVFDLFTMHRHVKMDLFIAVQSFARIDKSLREVVELVYWATNRSYLPYHKYYGYYDLEKLGSMKKDHHVMHITWKSKRLRNYYDTFSMKEKFAHKPMVPLNKWSDRDLTRKEKVQLWTKHRKLRTMVKIKRLRRQMTARFNRSSD
ncbi:hypothetical protein CD32_00195 [Lysinibacillus odysseyi 34hs-1 = NBRC 100172]|uniref:Zona occludens toxin N-terminal domain-containing protein n=1 Tax=Lysinibacillus odysseyi 34hs-1 = NBRC 100172 TaxID=1220589 RepID=A0A0A3IY28_9BACI|nr:hypothetical protein CD32_00195 [Lysinibacillus odysseyi 34hs-1 = NBRC 100172]